MIRYMSRQMDYFLGSDASFSPMRNLVYIYFAEDGFRVNFYYSFAGRIKSPGRKICYSFRI